MNSQVDVIFTLQIQYNTIVKEGGPCDQMT